MVKTLKNILAAMLAAVLVVGIGTSVYNVFAAPGSSPFAAFSQPAAAPENGNGHGNGTGTGQGTSLDSIPASDLSEAEAAALLFMREEEKLARDVYNALYATWAIPTFQNIAASEQAHMDEIKVLLDRYSLADPALEAGVFTNPDLQALYTQLVAQGSVSAAEALKVGGAIEEIDILDLQERLAQTDNADLQQVFTNLMSGSENHLRAFAQAYQTQTGSAYAPQYLSADAYAAILGASSGNGNSAEGGQGNGGGAQGSGSGQQGSGGGQGNGNGGGQGAQTQTIDISTATTLQGTVVSYDGMGVSLTTADGQALYVQLGNSAYNQSLGIVLNPGDSISIYGFTGDEGLFTAISLTVESTGITYTFRDAATGRPLWSGGGNGRGNGGGKN